MTRAFICRYGHQDIYRLLGRDPAREPLTTLERMLFAMCVQEHVVEERRPMLPGESTED